MRRAGGGIGRRARRASAGAWLGSPGGAGSAARGHGRMCGTIEGIYGDMSPYAPPCDAATPDMGKARRRSRLPCEPSPARSSMHLTIPGARHRRASLLLAAALLSPTLAARAPDAARRDGVAIA